MKHGRAAETFFKHVCLLIITVIRSLVEKLYLIKSSRIPRRDLKLD